MQQIGKMNAPFGQKTKAQPVVDDSRQSKQHKDDDPGRSFEVAQNGKAEGKGDTHANDGTKPEKEARKLERGCLVAIGIKSRQAQRCDLDREKYQQSPYGSIRGEGLNI